GAFPIGLTIAPDQPPTASFTTILGPFRNRPEVPLSFDASASRDPDGTVARDDWSFGDGQGASLNAGAAAHAFAEPGTYEVSLKVIDAEGCSTSLIFTGQTASCNGLPGAQTAQTVKVAYPGVKVGCPKRAKPKGCAFKLQAVAAKPK